MKSKRIAERLETMGYKLTRRLNYWVVSCEELPWDWTFTNLNEVERWTYAEEQVGFLAACRNYPQIELDTMQ